MTPLETFVESPAFNRFVTAVIVLAALLIGLETYTPVVERFGELLRWSNTFILGIFAIEVALRFAATWPQPGRFVRHGWNLFDLSIVLLSLLPGLAAFTPAVRLIRLLRVLRLLRTVPELQVILGALLRSIPAMSYVLLLLLLFLYVYAVIGVSLFGQNDPVHFRDLHTALLTLFKTLTGEGWIDFFDIGFYGCDRIELPFSDQCTQPQATPLVAVLYFTSYIVLGTMIFLNLLVGIVVNSMDEVRKNHERFRADDRARAFNEIQTKLFEVQQLLQRFEDRWGDDRQR
jgi:voltage-gated sodium channel